MEEKTNMMFFRSKYPFKKSGNQGNIIFKGLISEIYEELELHKFDIALVDKRKKEGYKYLIIKKLC